MRFLLWLQLSNCPKRIPKRSRLAHDLFTSFFSLSLIKYFWRVTVKTLGSALVWVNMSNNRFPSIWCEYGEMLYHVKKMKDYVSWQIFSILKIFLCYLWIHFISELNHFYFNNFYFVTYPVLRALSKCCKKINLAS